MNYIELINWFWGLDEQWQFSCCETRLYFYLVKTANRLGWADNWTHSDAKTSVNVGVSLNTMKTARNRLSQVGLIKFFPGGKGQKDKTRYQILTPNLIPNLTPNLTPNLIPNQTPINKLNKTSNNIPPIIPHENNLPFPEEKPKKKSSRAKKEFIPPVLDDVLKFFSGSLLPDWENQGRLFFSHYNSQGWRKGTGVQVTDWDSLANKWILDEKIKRDARSTGSKTNNPASGNGYAGK